MVEAQWNASEHIAFGTEMNVEFLWSHGTSDRTNTPDSQYDERTVNKGFNATVIDAISLFLIIRS